MRATLSAGHRRGLSLPLLLAVLGLVVPTTAALALVWLQGQAADRLVHAQEGRLLAREAAQFAERLRAFVEPSEQDLAFVAGLARADILVSDDPARIERFLFERARTRSWIRSLFLFLERSGQLILVSPHADGRSWQAMRQGFDRGLGTELRELDEDFELIREEFRPSLEFDPRERPWYKIVASDGRPTWTRPYRLYPSGLPGVTVVAPLLAADGSRTGVVGASLRLRELDRFLRSLAGKGEGGLAVIERDGTVLGSSLAAEIDVKEADLPGLATHQFTHALHKGGGGTSRCRQR